ncbi:response regulator transcription factor [candidate division KSB1 bacterium]|nr:response regulator transcription factor [candidate division KSB1 bacterium]
MKKTYRALVIDDERLARKDLIAMLGQFDNIEIIGEAENVPTAKQAIDQLNPDIIFLDIQMPGETGFDLIEQMEIHAKIIFVTAFDEFAIRAFEVNALDYLLKPISAERLARALERLEVQDASAAQPTRKLDYNDRMFLMIDNHMKFIKVKSILSIESAGDYSDIRTHDGIKGLTLKSMKEWEARLPDTYFVRIHRSTIINMDYIDKVEEWFNYSFRVYLKGMEKPFVISRRYASKLKVTLG